jgi:hypothetical protein
LMAGAKEGLKTRPYQERAGLKTRPYNWGA